MLMSTMHKVITYITYMYLFNNNYKGIDIYGNKISATDTSKSKGISF